jgi:hypothetical protein
MKASILVIVTLRWKGRRDQSAVGSLERRERLGSLVGMQDDEPGDHLGRDVLGQHVDHQDPRGDREQSSRHVQRASDYEIDERVSLKRTDGRPRTRATVRTDLSFAGISKLTIRRPGRRTPIVDSSSPIPDSSSGEALI